MRAIVAIRSRRVEDEDDDPRVGQSLWKRACRATRQGKKVEYADENDDDDRAGWNTGFHESIITESISPAGIADTSP